MMPNGTKTSVLNQAETDVNSKSDAITDGLMDLLVSLNIHPAHSLGSQWRLLQSKSKCQGNPNFEHLNTWTLPILFCKKLA